MRKKIVILTTSRADYGLLYNLIELFQKKKKKYDVKLIVSGSHLSKKHGFTINEIKKDNLKIYSSINIIKKVKIKNEIIYSSNKIIDMFSKNLSKINPNLVIILGDRFEVFGAAYASFILKIPIAHISGGDVTMGAQDDVFRHCITKMSWWHFVSNNISKKRVIQLGENPNRVFNVGSLGADMISNIKFYSKKYIEKKTGIKFAKKNIFITFHPETLSSVKTIDMFKEILNAISQFNYINFIFSSSNFDFNGNVINELILKYIKDNKNAYFYNSFGRNLYLSIVKNVDAVLGNSSSGITEVPLLNKFTINVGDRQLGRYKAKSIIDTKCLKKDIIVSINYLYNKNKSNLKKMYNPYSIPGASKKIFKIIDTNTFPKSLKKPFYDLKK